MGEIVVAVEGMGLDPVGGFASLDDAKAFAARRIGWLREMNGPSPRCSLVNFREVAVVVRNTWSAPEQREYLRLPYLVERAA